MDASTTIVESALASEHTNQIADTYQQCVLIDVVQTNEFIEVILTPSLVDFFFSSRRRHTRCSRDWSSDVCSSDLFLRQRQGSPRFHERCSLHQFHHEVRKFVRRAQAEDMHDVRMADLRQCARFVHKARLDGFFRAVASSEYFDRDFSVQSLVRS